MLIDKVKVYVKAGDGGNGAVTFRREKYVSHGGPDGGDGGRGGNIIITIDEGTNTLLDYKNRRKFIAQNGENGSGAKFHGGNGKDTVLPVPPGTVIKDAESGLVIKDMSEDGEPFVLCRGGKGGWGNRQRLVVRLVCAFCCGAGVTLNNLSMELASEEVFRRPEGYLIHTYVSNYQYVFLKETAAAQRMSVEGMLTAAAELLVGTDDEGSGYHIPESLGRIADRVFEVRGSTLKDFRRQCLVSIRTNTIGPDRIASFMEKHGIASAREFLRRVVLFFLEARYLIYRKEVELDEDDLPEEEETDWEETMYSQYQKRDFAISTYNY